MKHTAVSVLNMSWAPSNTWNFVRSYIVVLDLFCSHCRRRSYLIRIWFLTVPSHVIGVYCNGWEKNKTLRGSHH